MLQKWIRISFIYLIIVGIIGVFLRMLFFAPIEGINFRYFLHAHSHVAFLGWIFNALFAGLIFAYIPEKAKTYQWLFWLLQVAVVGMLVSFPIQGYAAASISFTSLHVFLSWWFAAKFWRDTLKTTLEHKLSLTFVRWSLFFMALSSIGPFGLGVIMAKGLSGTPLANLAIYFYLHFQYDGWFSFAIFGMFLWFLEDNKISFPFKYGKAFLILMAIACIPTYALSTLWTQPSLWVYAVAFLAALLQIIAGVYLFLFLKAISLPLKNIGNRTIRNLFLFALIAFYLKIILQFFSAFPPVADLAYTVRNFTIGFLHIVFLGFVSVFLIAWFAQYKLINLSNKGAQKGVWLFLIGFILSELLIFFQPLLLMKGIMIPHYFKWVFWVSVLMPIGIGVLYIYSNPQRKLLSGLSL